MLNHKNQKSKQNLAFLKSQKKKTSLKIFTKGKSQKERKLRQ